MITDSMKIVQAPTHKYVNKGALGMEKPRKTVFMNDNQTKVTLIGKWFFMTPDEIKNDYESRLENGDPLIQNINSVLCKVALNQDLD